MNQHDTNHERREGESEAEAHTDSGEQVPEYKEEIGVAEFGTRTGVAAQPHNTFVSASLHELLDHLEICKAKRVCKTWNQTLSRGMGGFLNLNLEGKQNIAKTLTSLKRHSKASDVRHISLRFCGELSDDDLHLLSGFKHLESVNLDYCQKVSDDGIRILCKNWARPRHLSLFWMPWLSGSIVEPLEQCTQLRTLNLSGLTHLTDTQIGELIRSVGANLRYLDLTRIKSVKTHSLRAIGETCMNLETLRMYACEFFADQDIAYLAKCKRLSTLDVCGAKALHDNGVVAVSRACTRLQTLNLTWCVHLTDRSLAALAGCKFLCNLSIHGLKHVTDSGMQALAKGCKEIVTLDVNGCCNVQRRSLQQLQELFPRLKTLVQL